MVKTVTTLGVWSKKLEHEVRRCLDTESSGHDPWHAMRVRDLAISIGKVIGADIDVVEAAALLHDIGHVSGRDDHSQTGANLAGDLLFRAGFPADKIAPVTACIHDHHWLPGRAGDPKAPSLEYQAFADADRLDALGAIGIARVFAFGGAHQRPLWNPDPSGAVGQYGISSIHHFYDKLLRLPGDMYTGMGRRIATERVTVMRDFLQTFYREWGGDDLEAAANF